MSVRRLGSDVSAIGVVAMLLVHFAPLRAEQIFQLDIAALPAKQAIEQLHTQTRQHFQLLARPEVLQGQMTRPVKGIHTLDAALTLLFEGTSLTFVYVNDHTVVIFPVPELPSTVPDTGEHATEPTVVGDVTITSSAIRGPGLRDSKIEGFGPLTGVSPGATELFTMQGSDLPPAVTAQDAVRLLPQNFNGGPSEDTRSGEAAVNMTEGTGANLRGLGSDSTLVLINGRELPRGGQGRFADLSGIPVSAVERLEVLPFSAAAIYGGDALAGVLNFVLVDDYDGDETQVRYGAVTRGSTSELQLSHTSGRQWSSSSGVLSFDLYSRDALPAEERAQSASSDLRPFGGDNFDVLEGNPGTIVHAGQTWAVPAGQDGRSLRATELVGGTTNLHNRNANRDLLGKQERHSVSATYRYNFAENSQLFADVLYSRRYSVTRNPSPGQALQVPSTNPFFVHPGGGTDPVTVYYGFEADLGPQMHHATATVASVAAGATMNASNEWRLMTHFTRSHSGEQLASGPFINQTALASALADADPTTAFNPFGDGAFTSPETLASIRENALLHQALDISSVNLAATGPLFDLPERTIALGLGAEYEMHTLRSSVARGSTVFNTDKANRDVAAVYANLSIPLLRPDNSRRGANQIVISPAARYDGYGDFGSGVAPALALKWSVHPHFSVRGTWSKAFRAPHLADLNESQNRLILLSQRDPASPSTFVPALVWFGDGNRDLRQETAASWQVGAHLTWPTRGFLYDVTYFSFSLKDRVERPLYSGSLLQDPFAKEIITFSPSQLARENVCHRATMLGTQEDCLNAPIAALIDLRPQNISRTDTSGVDIRAHYGAATRAGLLDVDLNASKLFTFSRARFPSSPTVELLDTQNNPLDLRVRGSIAWTYRGLQVRSTVSYFDSYLDTLSQPARDVSAWSILDVDLSYDFGSLRHAFLGSSVLGLSVQNLFDEHPPFLNNPIGVGYDEENADLLGRFARVHIRKRW